MKAQIPWLRVFVEGVVIVGFLVPAHGSAQDSLSVSCADVDFTSLEDLTRCAGQGLVEGQFLLGLKYANGEGVGEDKAEAVRWYRLAAEQGDDRAQYNLGLMYANGEGVPEDQAEAARLYGLAAGQGHFRAQFRLGLMYANGEGVPEDLIFAYLWWDLSAAGGHEIARARRDIIERRMTREQIAEARRLFREWIETHPQDGGN